MERARSVLGIFVGGRARRMGGFPKGLLPVSESGGSIVEHLVRLAREADLEAVLVGGAPSAMGGEPSPYVHAAAGIAMLEDDPPGIGPLGGLAALLTYARDRTALAIACDMPFVTNALVERLRGSSLTAPIVAARLRPDGPFEPFLARYDASRVAPILAEQLQLGTRSFQKLFAACEVAEWPLEPEERAAWDDWDTVDDLPDWARP